MDMKRHLSLAAALLLGLTICQPVTAQAVAIAGLFNTGVDGSGALLGGGVDDPHYAIISQPVPGTPDFTLPAINGSWSPNDAVSRWIGPDQYPGGNNGDPGTYVYRTTFTLPGSVDLLSVMLGGQWAADNNGSDILINGVSTGQTAPAFFVPGAFSVTSGFLAGLNTLDFVVVNLTGTPNPTGLRVTGLAGTFELAAIPEAGSLGLLGLALAGLGLASRRRPAR
jgi:hypothetical protein